MSKDKSISIFFSQKQNLPSERKTIVECRFQVLIHPETKFTFWQKDISEKSFY